MRTGRAQALGRDLLQIALAGEEHGDGIVRHGLFLGAALFLGQVVEDLAAAGLAVLLCHVGQFLHDNFADAGRLCEDVVQISDVGFQLLDLAGALEDIFPVEVAQLDLGHIVGLHFVDAEADHQVGDDFRLLLRGADDVDGLVNVHQNRRQTLKQVEALFLAVEVVIGASADAFHPEGRPLLQNLPHPHDPGLARDKDVEVAAEAVFQRGGLEELGHQLVGVHAALEVEGELEAVQVGLVAHIADLFDLARLDQLGDLVHDGLHRGGGRYLGDLDHVLARHGGVAGAHLHAAAAILEDVPHLGFVVEDLAAAHEVRGGHGGGDVVLCILHESDGGAAQLGQIEGADVAGHADGDAQRVVGQNGREGHGQKGRFGGGAVVVGDEVHRLFVDVPEQLFADTFQLGFGVAGCGTGHIAAVGFAEVALAVHERHQQALVAPAHADHGVIDGGVAVGVQVHGAAHDVRRLGARALDQAHLIHRIQQLAVGGLEAVDLRQGAADDDAHGVGHIVRFQRAGDGVFQHTAGVQYLNALAQLGADRLCGFFARFLCHCKSSLLEFPRNSTSQSRYRSTAPLARGASGEEGKLFRNAKASPP